MISQGHNSGLDPDGRVRDATDLNWVDRWCPPWSRPWLRLSRADRPIGTWLLLIPCYWGLALAAVKYGWSWWDLWLVPACTIGAFLMRGAGCTWNDYTDREIDAEVARTRSRPIPSGQVSPSGALVWMVIQALLAFLILITFNWAAIWWGVASLAIVCVYPFAKRFTWWPQVFLGLAFNWGVLLMWVAKTGSIDLPPVFLYIAGIAWTLHYDTIYAHQDKEDDALIGVKSTALLFMDDTKPMFWMFTGLVGILATMAVLISNAGWLSIIGVLAMLGHMAWQTIALDIDDPEQCLRIFRASRYAGLFLLAGMVLDTVI